MLIRKPVREVFEALVNPDITSKFWFTRESGRLEAGKRVRRDWEMYDVDPGIHADPRRIEGAARAGVKLNLVADRYPSGVDEQEITKEWRSTPYADAPGSRVQ